MRAAKGDAKAGHHFVKDQQRGIGTCDLSKLLQIAVPRRHAAHVADDRFRYDSRDLAFATSKCLFNSLNGIKRECQREPRLFFEYARRSWYAERRHAGSRLHQQRIGVAVITALEFHDVLASGICARQADGRHCGFGTGTHEAHHLDGRKRLGHEFCQFSFCRSGSSEAGAVLGCALHRLHYLGIGMAKDHWPPGAYVIDVFVPVGVPKLCALRPYDHRRLASHCAECAHGRIHAAGKELLGAMVK